MGAADPGLLAGDGMLSVRLPFLIFFDVSQKRVVVTLICDRGPIAGAGKPDPDA